MILTAVVLRMIGLETVQAIQDERAAIVYTSHKDAISLFYSGGCGLTKEILAEGVRKISGVADLNADLDFGQLERDITRKLKLSPDVRVCDQAFAVQPKVQEFFHDRKLSAVFVPNGRWAKRLDAIAARVILAGLTPPGFRDDVGRRVQFEDASSDPYRVVHLMEEMSQWAAIDEYQRGARSSGRGGWKQPSGDGRRSSPRGEAHASGASGQSSGKGCWSCGSTDHKENKNTRREAKATEDGRGGAGGRGPPGGRKPKGSTRPPTRSSGVVRPGIGTQESAGQKRWQQQ